MGQLIYSQLELEAEHEYARPHIECDLKLHGGFDEQGLYLSPRTKHRWPAINNWLSELASAEHAVLEAGTELLTEPNFPNVAQAVFLLENGVDQFFWDSLTITGLIEARGKVMAEITPPNFQDIIKEDISGMALGHMDKGLMTSHGWDEGGNPASDLGGHDTMWFAARDLVLGKDRFEIPVPPASIGREKDEREMSQIPVEHEMMMSFLMNLLMIEVRAERAFQFYEEVMRHDTVFVDKRDEAEQAIELVNRIRQDESVHVAWLKAAISEFRACNIKTVSGEQILGAEIIDPLWQKMVHWHAIEQHEKNRKASEESIESKICAEPNGSALVEQFRQLA